MLTAWPTTAAHLMVITGFVPVSPYLNVDLSLFCLHHQLAILSVPSDASIIRDVY